MSDAVKLLSGSKSYSNAEYITPGNYILEVAAIRANDGYNGLSFIAEFTVIDAEKTEANEPNIKGHVVSYVEGKCDDKKKGPAKLGRFKGFIRTVLGLAEEGAETDQGLADALGPKQAAAFFLVQCVAWSKVLPADPVTGAKGITFTNMTWKALPDDMQDLEAIQAKRKTAGLPAL